MSNVISVVFALFLSPSRPKTILLLCYYCLIHCSLSSRLAASLAAEEEMEINKNVLTSEGGLDEAEDDNEEMIFVSSFRSLLIFFLYIFCR